VLNNTTADWEAPVTMPVVEGNKYTWDEPTLAWVEVEVPV
jgi:hypothetical protein